MMQAIRMLMAVEFAAKWHKRQKYGDEYSHLYHCAQVGLKVARRINALTDGNAPPPGLGVVDNIVIAGVLHDILEDTNCSPMDIADIFGKDVMLLVMEITKYEHETTNEHYGKMGTRGMLIKVADRMANLNNIGCQSPTTNKWLFDKVLPRYEEELPYYNGFPKVAAAVKEAIERKR
jgi:(p)ppGpp synthase/HD superfamily hydrolase